MMERQALFLRGLHALRDPALEFFYGLAADGKLDEMKWHVATLEHDPEKWKPVKDRAQTKNYRESDSGRLKQTLATVSVSKDVNRSTLPELVLPRELALLRA
jgi:hypothetical protein